MTYPIGQPKPYTYIVARRIEYDESGNYSYKTIPAGILLYRYTGNTYNTCALPTGVMVSETGPLGTPFFEVPLCALQVHEYQPGKTTTMSVLPDNTETVWP